MKKNKIIAALIALIITMSVLCLLKEVLSSRIINVSCELTSDHDTELVLDTSYSSDVTADRHNLSNSLRKDVKLKASKRESISFKAPLTKGNLELLSLHFSLDRAALPLTLVIDELEINHKNLMALFNADNIGLSDGIRLVNDDNGSVKLYLEKSGYISFKTPLGIKYERDFNYYALFIFFIVICALSYVVLRFLLNTRTYQKEHTANIVFVMVLAVSLVIPASKIDYSSTINYNEYRAMAEYKPLFTGNPFSAEGRYNLRFGKDFENWFNDRFRERKHLVGLDNNLRYALSYKSFHAKDVYKYKDWVWSYEDFMSIDENNVKKMSRTLNEMQKHWNKKILAIVYPVKSEIFCENSLSVNCPLPSEKLYSLLKNNVKNDNIIVYSALEVSKLHKQDKDLMYFKDEHHMTQYGAQMIIDDLIAKGILPQSNNDYHQYDARAKCTTGELIFDQKICEENLIYGQSYGLLRGHSNRAVSDKKMNIAEGYLYYSMSDAFNRDIKNTESSHKGYSNFVNKNTNAFKFTPMVMGNSFVETLALALSTRYSHVIRWRFGFDKTIPLFDMDERIEKDEPDLIITTIYRDGIFNSPISQ